MKIPRFDYDKLSELTNGKSTVILNSIKDYPPDIIYEIKDTGQIVIILSYFEDGTVQVKGVSSLNPAYAGEPLFTFNPSGLRPL